MMGDPGLTGVRIGSSFEGVEEIGADLNGDDDEGPLKLDVDGEAVVVCLSASRALG